MERAVNLYLDLYRFGRHSAEAGEPTMPSGIELKSVDAPLSQMTGDALTELLNDSNADWVAFADRAINPTMGDLFQLSTVCKTNADVVCVVIPLSPVPELRACWKNLPPRLAVLLTQPESHTLIAIRKSANGEFRDVDAPLWDALIRASSNRSLAVVLPETPPTNEPVEDAIELPALAAVTPGESRDWLPAHVSKLQDADLVPEIGNRHDVVALKAGLLQLHDYLDESHDLSQSVQGEGEQQAGDYWHAIMHRREPDDSNAKYWFRRVGRNPVYSALADRADSLLSQCESTAAASWKKRLRAANGWDPFAFVDLCEHCRQADDRALTCATEEIQFVEMLLLIEQTYHNACA